MAVMQELPGEILFYIFVRNSKVITERTESDHKQPVIYSSEELTCRQNCA
jgi:hypothetical protein